MMSKEYTYDEVVREASAAFERAGLENCMRDAQLLMLHLLKIEMAQLISQNNKIMPANLIAQFSALVKRRLNREPLQYITKRADFWDIPLYVDPRVLVPRPETEHIIEEVLLDFKNTDRAFSVVDVGTGSGCLAITLAREYSRSKVFAIDIDKGALEVAAINASRQNVLNRVTFLNGSLLEPLNQVKTPKTFNAIVANLPYIAEDDVHTLQPEVIKYEPWKSLISGEDGLDDYRELIPTISARLRRKGRAYLEIGQGQQDAVIALIEKDEGLRYVKTALDLQKIPRVIIAERNG